MNLHLDISIIVSPIRPDRADDLSGGLDLVQTGKQVVDGVARLYYAAHPPLRLLLVNRSGIDITSLAASGATVNAVVGWDAGESPYTLPENAGKQHSKITIFHVLSESSSSQTSLITLLAGVPRSDRPGGVRPGAGRPALASTPTRPYTVTLPTSLASWLIQVGQGNLSAGVREAARLAGYKEDEP